MLEQSKIITFIIPSYNSAATLRSCLDSFIVASLKDEMEVFIVNDGSTDETVQIAMEYVDKYPWFCLANKENGGHGSVINHAVQKAKGTYFKVIDSDDWIITENLSTFVSALRTAHADVILTHFHIRDIRNGQVQSYTLQDINFNREISLETFCQNHANLTSFCCFHGITYRTSFYQACGIRLSERISYEDQEYAILPFLQAESILPLDLYIYEYNIGYTDQSMSEANQVRRIDQLEMVFWNIANYRFSDLGEATEIFLIKRQQELIRYLVVTALLKNPNKAAGRAWAKRFRNVLLKRESRLHKGTETHYKLCVVLHWLGIKDSHIEKVRYSSGYGLLTKKLFSK